MSCFIQLLGSPKILEDGLAVDIGLPHPILPTWGPLARGAAPDARYPAPTGGNTTLSSTSTNELAQDAIVWASFLSYPQLEESRCTTNTRIYILRKPLGWQAQHYGLHTWSLAEQHNAQKRTEVLEYNWRLIYSTIDTQLIGDEFNRLGDVTPTTLKIITEQVTRLQATRYGVELYIEELDAL